VVTLGVSTQLAFSATESCCPIRSIDGSVSMPVCTPTDPA
jgi:hypothetical protein